MHYNLNKLSQKLFNIYKIYYKTIQNNMLFDTFYKLINSTYLKHTI